MRVGIIGTGSIAQLHARGLKSCGHEIAAVADISPQRAGDFAQKWNTVACSIEQLLERKLDLVSVTVPNVFHFEVAAQAIQAGHAVLCEKPMACNPAESAKLVELVARHGQPFFAGYMKRSHPTMQRFREYAARIGTPRSGMVRVYHPFPLHMWGWMAEQLKKDPQSLRPTVFNDGVFVNSGSHMLDLLLWSAGGVRRVLAARFQRHEGVTTDTAAHALLEMNNGATVTVECGWLPLTGVGRRENGWDEVLELRGDDGLARLFTTWWDRPETESPVADLWHEPTRQTETFNAGPVDYFAKEYELIALALQGQKVPLATVTEAAAVDTLISDVFAAAK